MHPFGMQPNKMRAIFAVFTPYAGLNTEQIGIQAIGAFPHRNTDLWNRQTAGAANSKKILAGNIMLAVLYLFLFDIIAENSATHENMGMITAIRFDLIEVFIYPVYAILAVNHEKPPGVSGA
jgi:hypothetical protein